MVEPGTVSALLDTIEHRLSRLNSMRGVARDEFEGSHDLQDIADLLAHGYARLVPGQVHAHFARLGDVRAYIEQVHRYLRQPGSA